MSTVPTTNPEPFGVELFDNAGKWLRTCPLGALEALDAVRRLHPSAADVKLSEDRTRIRLTFPHGARDRVYSYSLVVISDEKLPRPWTVGGPIIWYVGEGENEVEEPRYHVLAANGKVVAAEIRSRALAETLAAIGAAIPARSVLPRPHLEREFIEGADVPPDVAVAWLESGGGPDRTAVEEVPEGGGAVSRYAIREVTKVGPTEQAEFLRQAERQNAGWRRSGPGLSFRTWEPNGTDYVTYTPVGRWCESKGFVTRVLSGSRSATRGAVRITETGRAHLAALEAAATGEPA